MSPPSSEFAAVGSFEQFLTQSLRYSSVFSFLFALPPLKKSNAAKVSLGVLNK